MPKNQPEVRYLVAIPVGNEIRVFDIPHCDYAQHLTVESLIGWTLAVHTPLHCAMDYRHARTFMEERKAVEKCEYRISIIHRSAGHERPTFQVISA